MLTTTASLFLLLLLLVTYWYLSRPRNLPPGLPRFPIIGSLPFLTGDLRKRLTELKESYGEVSSVYLGGTLVVVLNGLDIIRETFGKRGQIFADRPDSYYRDHVVQRRGIAFSNGQNWKVVRRFSLQALRDFGMGKPAIEHRIMEEIDECMKELAKYDDKSINLEDTLATAVSNVACSVVLGKRFAYGDPVFEKYLGHVKGLFDACSAGGVLVAFPWLRHIPGDLFGFHKGRAHNQALLSIHRNIIKEHKRTRSEEEERDILDIFTDRLSQIEHEKNPIFSEPDLLQASQELVGAGTETTTTALRWGILFLAQNPEIQTQLQKEVDSVLGADGVPNFSMRNHMPKVEAFILETLRLGDVAPLAVPHSPLVDTTINGFTIPKGTMMFANIHGVHCDQTIWGDPDTFRPWRFLTDDGRINTDLSSYVPAFSVGKRACPGEGLARMELFLFSCRLLQRFTFSPPDGENLDNIGGNLGITYMPNPHKLKIRQRKDVY